jgi:hypothetical protein
MGNAKRAIAPKTMYGMAQLACKAIAKQMSSQFA